MPDQRPSPPAIRLSPAALLALLLFGALALFCHAYLRIRLQNAGISPEHAYNLSYLVVPPIALAPVPVILRGQTETFKKLFDPRRLDLRLVLGAIALGVLLRVIFWAKIVGRGALGIGLDPSLSDGFGPTFSFDCPSLLVLALGFLVMAILVPITEEILHRGVLQSAFVSRGPIVAIGLSALLFALFHQPSSYAWGFLIGIIVGMQFWRTQTLLATIITHGTYNGLAQIDWICLNSRWQPAPQDLPLVQLGMTAVFVGLIALTGIAVLLYRCAPGRT